MAYFQAYLLPTNCTVLVGNSVVNSGYWLGIYECEMYAIANCAVCTLSYIRDTWFTKILANFPD